MVTWQKQETLKLIDVWADDTIQSQLEGCHHNKDVYVRISRKMREAGFDRTFEQCREKIKKLKKDYRKIKDTLNGTGQGRNDEWPYFDAMDKVLGHKPATAPSALIDTLASNENDQNTSINDYVDEEDEPLFTDYSEDTSTTQTAPSDTTEPIVDSVPPRKTKKKKWGKSEQFEVVMDGMVKKLIDAQHKTEERFLDLEEKRMRLEERLIEQEVEMQRESRSFQLQMMHMMTSMLHGHNAASFPPPISSSTQYHAPPYYCPYDDDETQVP